MGKDYFGPTKITPRTKQEMDELMAYLTEEKISFTVVNTRKGLKGTNTKITTERVSSAGIQSGGGLGLQMNLK